MGWGVAPGTYAAEEGVVCTQWETVHPLLQETRFPRERDWGRGSGGVWVDERSGYGGDGAPSQR